MPRTLLWASVFVLAACSAKVEPSNPPTETPPANDTPGDDTPPVPEVDADLAPELIEARPYESKSPAGWDGVSKLPLVVALHGRGDTGPRFARYAHLTTLADEQGFHLAYPTGTNILGGSGWAAMKPIKGVSSPDDVKYIRAVIADMAAKLAVDRSRVVVVGLSLGGFMANYLACNAGDKIAGILSFAGSLVTEAHAECTSARPVSVTLVHGTADATILYEGGSLPVIAKPYPSASALYDYWSEKNGCGAETALPATDLDSAVPGTESTGKTKAECKEGTTVTLWTVDQGAHVLTLNKTVMASLVSGLTTKPRN